MKAPISAGGLDLANDIDALNHAKEQMRLVFRNNAEEIFEANSEIFLLYDKIGGNGKVETWEDLFDLAENQSFSSHSIIQNLVEIQ